MASIIEQGSNFDGSEVALIDLDEDRLQVVKRFSERLAKAKGLNLTVTATTDRRRGLADSDAVLSSFRPGGFEARALDEQIPLKHGVLGQETQGPGGFFMALRAIAALQGMVADMDAVCPKARIFNYTNPVNIVAEALTHFTNFPTVSLCEGPITFWHMYLELANLDIEKADVCMIGLNHGCWSVRHLYEGSNVLPLLGMALERMEKDPTTSKHDLRLMRLAVLMQSMPASYFGYYYFHDEIVAELRAQPMTRAQQILSHVPDYWKHYREQSDSEAPDLDPRRSRGGIHELELALDVMDAVYNDRKEVWPVNVPNNGSIADLPDDLVVETTGYVDKNGIVPITHGHLPRHVLGLIQMLGEYQALAARAAWEGTRRDAIRALAGNPLVFSLSKAETIYDELAAAHKQYLPDRLLR